ncbi:unnamed protein product [Schistosoma turkestanicum]|nr:unnamed protein product [Schistosoma turkestanicum]
MDSVFNKLKTKVSGALPGNPLTREYDIEKQIGQAGPGLLWKLYSAKKRSTHQEATIWIMEKKLLESYPKLQRESMIEILKHGVCTLTRIKHPKIVSVLQPLEESRESLAYATEPLFASLNSVLTRESPNTGQSNGSMEFSLSDIEIKYGLVQLAEALNFLHCDCHRLHLNLTPESIVINRFGIWKLGGFEFSKTADQSEKPEQSIVRIPVWQSNLIPTCQLKLDSSSPEAILEGEVTDASDMFSFGLLICTLFNRGKSILYVGDDYHAYKRMVKQLSSLLASKELNLPSNLKEYVKMMLSSDPKIRPNATSYFEDASISVLQSIDNMYQLDNLSRSQFYKSLPNSIHTLSKRLCLFRVFPQIAEDFSNPHMVPFILPAVLQILDLVTQDEFVQYMLPRLTPVLTMKEPIQIVLIFLQNLHILSEKFPIKEFRNYILPMLQSALDIDNKMIQELCLQSLPTIGKVIEITVLRNAFIRRIQRLCLSTEYLSTRMHCLLCIGKLLDYLDKWIVMDDILPFLQQIKSREPTILMAILGIHRLVFSHEKLGISREKLASKILPYLIPLSIESSLNLKQYSAYASLIRDMCSYLEREQYAKLEQLHGAAASDENSMIKIDTIDESVWATSNSCSDLMTRIICTYLDNAEQYVKRSPVSTTTTTTLANSNTTTNSSPPILSSTGMNGSIINENTSLSLEQKRQLAAKQNQIERFTSTTTSSSLSPQPIGPMKLTRTTNKPVDITNTLIAYNVNAINQNTSELMMMNNNNTKSTIQKNYIGTGIPLALLTPPPPPAPQQNGVFNSNNNNSAYYYSNNIDFGQLQSNASLPNAIVPFTSNSNNHTNHLNSLTSMPFTSTTSNMMTMKPFQPVAVPNNNTLTHQSFPITSSSSSTASIMLLPNQTLCHSSNSIKPLSKSDIDDLLS